MKWLEIIFELIKIYLLFCIVRNQVNGFKWNMFK